MDFDDVSRGYEHARYIGRVITGGILQVFDKVKYIDVDSFVNWYLLNEITRNYDSKFVTSCYCFTDENGKVLPNDTKLNLTIAANGDYDVHTEDLNGDSIVVPITVDTMAPQLLELKPVSDASGNYLELTISENTNLADVFVMNPGNTRILAESPFAVNNGDGTLTCVFEDICPVVFCVEEDYHIGPPPKTGDEFGRKLPLWIALMVVSLIAIVVLVVLYRKKDKDGHKHHKHHRHHKH